MASVQPRCRINPTTAAVTPESAAESLARVVERRAWGEAWPGILEIEVGQVRLERTIVGFHVPGDEIATRWAFLDEHGWCLTSVKLPD